MTVGSGIEEAIPTPHKHDEHNFQLVMVALRSDGNMERGTNEEFQTNLTKTRKTPSNEPDLSLPA